MLLVEQFARGELAPDLRLPAEPWVERLWREGFYPFEPPFTDVQGERTFLWCPLPFEYLTAPAYAALGWRGIYLWPVLGVLGLWLAVWWVCRRLEVGPPATAIAIFAVAFCSPITMYGAMFWEHSPGVALAFGGLALLAAPALRSRTLNALVAGGLLGLSVWFRGELVWLAFVSAALLPFAGRLGLRLEARRAFFAGLAVAGLGFLAWNAALYGDPAGITSKHFLQEDSLTRAEGIARIFQALMAQLLVTGPALALALVGGAAVIALRLGGEPPRGAIRFWGLLALAFGLGVVLVVPNTVGAGGMQIGPRYELVVYPMATIVLAASLRPLWESAGALGRAGICAVVALGLVGGAWTNAVRGGAELAIAYGPRMRPALDAVRAHPAPVLVVTHQYVAQGLVPFFGTKPVFLAKGAEDLKWLAFALAERGHPDFTVVSFEPMTGSVPGTVARKGATLEIAFTGCHGRWPLCTAQASVRLDGR